MLSPNIIYFGSHINPFLRYNDNKYILKNKGKDYIQFICTKKGICKTKIWTNLVNIHSTEFHILKIDNECQHPKTLNEEQWNKLWAINEMCIMSQNVDKHVAYDDWLLSNPQHCTLFHDYYEVKNKLYRFTKSNPESMPTNEDQFTKLLTNTIYKYNYWGFNKRKQLLDKNYNDFNHTFIFQANICSVSNLKIEKNDNNNQMNVDNDENNKNNDASSALPLQQIIQLRLDKVNNQREINKLNVINSKINSKLMLNTIPSEYDMIFYQGNGGNNDFQCFFTKRLIKHLDDCDESICDFTFAVTPTFGIAANKDLVKYVQLFCCHFKTSNIDMFHVHEAIPTLFILMANKSKKLYRSAFKYVVNRLRQLGCNVHNKPNDKKRICAFDYEIHERDEFAEAFAIDIVKGCLMHFSGNVRKNFQVKGFQALFKSKDKKHKRFIFTYTMIRCVSLLPEKSVYDGWEIVKAELMKLCPRGYKQKLNNFILYFENTYMDGLFKLSDWNFYRSDDRTQNVIERTHKTWLKKAGHHPLPIPFLNLLREIEALAHIRYLQIQQYGKTRLKSSDEREKEDHLSRLWDLYDSELISIKEFLTCSSFTLRTNFKALDTLYDKYDITYYIHSGDLSQDNDT